MEKSLNGRVSILGGTFDPVHFGHLLLAEQAAEQLHLDHIVWIPAATAPHQTLKHSTDQKHRLEMVKLAIAGNPRFSVDDRELRRGGQSYTVDTLEELQRDFTDAQWVLLMGGDSLSGFPMWRDPQRICALAHVIVIARGGHELPDLTVLARFLPNAIRSQDLASSHLLITPQVEISSTDIRDRVRLGKSIRYLVPAAVEAYICANKLYLQDENNG